jgi:hypothetical protein
VKYLTPYKLATYLLLLFFLGHTGGGMLGQKSMGPASDAVFESMKAVHFDFNGADSTWYGFWFGFGIFASVFLLFSAVLSWQLDKLSKATSRELAVVAWSFAASHVACALLSWKYFFAGPGTIGTLVALLLGVGALRKQQPAA